MPAAAPMCFDFYHVMTATLPCGQGGLNDEAHTALIAFFTHPKSSLNEGLIQS